MNTSEYYTTKEVADILKKSVATIHKYISEGKLEPVDDQWRAARGKRFSKESVEAFKETMEIKTGLSMSEAADYLQITRSAVQTYLDQGLIPFEKKKWRNKDTVFIQKANLNEFLETQRKRLTEDRIKQRSFFDKKKKTAYYQRFSSATIQEARLIRKGLSEWSFFITETDETLSYNEGIYKHELTPDYPLLTGKNKTTPGYARIELARHYSLTRKFIDLLYQHCFIGDLYMDIDDQKDTITIWMKDITFEHVPEGIAEFIENKLLEGRVTSFQQQMKIESGEKTFTFHMSEELKEKVKKIADQQGTSMQDVVNNILETHFEKQEDVTQ
jgi:predicted site-specific integrase-resolvase/predicted DNA binding CopG/RHH family protein